MGLPISRCSTGRLMSRTFFSFSIEVHVVLDFDVDVLASMSLDVDVLWLQTCIWSLACDVRRLMKFIYSMCCLPLTLRFPDNFHQLV